MKKSVSELSLTSLAKHEVDSKYSMVVKNAGWDIHMHIHRHGYAEKLLSRKFSVDDYGMYIIQLFHIYDTIEVLMTQSTDPLLMKFWELFGKRLKRTDLLISDLEYYYGSNWRSKLNENKLYATDYYTSRLIKVYNKNPYLLLAHAYIRYFGDLNGGRIIRKRFLKNNNLTEGMYFYTFSTDLKLLKKDYRLFLDKLGWVLSDREKKLFLVEVKEGYLLNYSLFTDLFMSHKNDKTKYKCKDSSLLNVVQVNTPLFGMVIFVVLCCFVYPLFSRE
jgi:heme oxygenase